MKRARSVDWIVCTAGRGSRFAKHGITTPKAKIKFNTKTFLERSLSCLELLPQDQLIIISDKAHNLSPTIEDLKKEIPWIKIIHVELSESTSGQLASFYSCKEHLREDASLVIWNCDTFFKSHLLNKNLRDTTCTGLVPCGKMPGEHWSFFKTDSSDIITEVQEKVKISDWASVGFYHFSNSKDVLNAAKEILSIPPTLEQKEHYVSSVYPKLIQNKNIFMVCPVDVFLPFGTPAEIEKYWNVDLEQLKRDNT